MSKRRIESEKENCVNTKANYNAVLCEPTLLYDFDDPFRNIQKAQNINGIKGLMSSKIEELGIAKADLADPFEYYLRSMLGACACSVSVPAYGRSMWASPRQIKSVLSKSTAKRLKFADQNHLIWRAVEQYLKPIHDDLQKEFSGVSYQRNIETSLSGIVWDFYLLLLAVRENSEVPMLPSRTVAVINRLNRQSGLRSESRARLSIIKGIFALFTKNTDIPGFRCTPSNCQSLRERLDEILDDAYLLDASVLRRFFGLQANNRSIRRDLRNLVAFIAKNRPWAKGAVAAATQTAILPSSAAEVIDKVLELFPDLSLNCSGPVLINSDYLLADTGKLLIVSSRRVAFRQDENWMVVCRANKAG